MKKILASIGTGAAGIVLFVIYVAVSLTIMYFSIKFVMYVGDKIFNREDSAQARENLEYQESYYVGVCTEEVLKQDPSADNKRVRSFCQCNHDAILEAAGSKENFIEYQNTVDEGTIAELTTHCRSAYNS